MTSEKPNADAARGIPTATNVDHVGLTVPDLEGAIAFFTGVLGCDLLYKAGPFEDPDGDSFSTTLRVDPRARLNLAFLRCGPATNVELLEFAVSGRGETPPKNSDAGASHLAFYVADMDAAISYLKEQPGVEILGEPTVVGEGPSEGLTYVYFLSPWGQQFELATPPPGMPYERTTSARPYGPAPSWREG